MCMSSSLTHFVSLLMKQDHASVLVDGTCQIPDPVYKLVGSIVCFYIPLGVMLITYCLTVRLLARQQQSLSAVGSGNSTGATAGGVSTTNGNQPNGWGSGWLGSGQQTNIGKTFSVATVPLKILFNHQFNPFQSTREEK